MPDGAGAARGANPARPTHTDTTTSSRCTRRVRTARPTRKLTGFFLSAAPRAGPRQSFAFPSASFIIIFIQTTLIAFPGSPSSQVPPLGAALTLSSLTGPTTTTSTASSSLAPPPPDRPVHSLNPVFSAPLTPSSSSLAPPPALRPRTGVPSPELATRAAGQTGLAGSSRQWRNN